MKRWIFGAISILILSFPGKGYSQSDSLDVWEDRELLGREDLKAPKTADNQEVFSALRSQKKIGDLPLNIYIVTREEIHHRNYVSLSDVLKSIPGIRTSQPGSAANGDMFLMGGLIGNTYTKILLNGLPLQNSATGSFPIGEQLPIRQAERIEIIFGPASALYGADALVGVINIITHVSEESNYAEVDILGGRGAGYHYSVLAGGKLGKNEDVLSYQVHANVAGRNDVNIFQEISDSFNPKTYLRPEIQQIQDEDSLLSMYYPLFYRGTSTNPTINELPQQNRLLGIQFQYRGFQASFTHMTRRQHSSVGLNPLFYHYADPNSYWGEALQRWTLSYERKGDKWQSLTNLSYMRMRFDPGSSISTTFRVDNLGKKYLYAASDDLFAEELFTYKPSKFWEITGGASLQMSSVLPLFTNLLTPFDESLYIPFNNNISAAGLIPGEGSFNSIRYFTYGGFAQVYGAFNKLTVILGGRIDNNTFYGRSVNPRLALQYKANEQLSMKGSIGTAFRGPINAISRNSLPLEVVQDRDSVLIGATPLEVLRPEEYFSTDIGIKYQPNSSLEVELTAYYQKLTNLVQVNTDEAQLADLGSEGLTSNSSEAGIELLSVQLRLMAREFIPVLRLGTELSLTVNEGKEVWAPPNLRSDPAKIFEGVRQLPPLITKLRLFAEPVKNWWIESQINAMSSSLPAYIPLGQIEADNITRNPGYVNVDLSVSTQLSPTINVSLSAYNLANSLNSGLEAYATQIVLRANPQLGRQLRFEASFQF